VDGLGPIATVCHRRGVTGPCTLNDIQVPLTASGYELMKGDVPHWQSGPELSTMSSADHRLMGVHALPTPGPSTESEHEMMDVVPSSPVSPTNRVGQSMGVDFPSGKRRKRKKNLLASDQPAKPKGPFGCSVTWLGLVASITDSITRWRDLVLSALTVRPGLYPLVTPMGFIRNRPPSSIG
jgi:hypothetical protein